MAITEAKTNETLQAMSVYANSMKVIEAVAGAKINVGDCLVIMTDGRVAPIGFLDPDQEHRERDRRLHERLKELRAQGKTNAEIAEELFE